MGKESMKSDFKTYHNHRVEPYFSFVKNGQKTIEGRLKKEQYRFIEPGDHIVIHNEKETDSVEVIVADIRFYDSIREMLKREPLEKVLPDVKTVKQGIEIYNRFYTEEQQQKFDVVAIEIKRV